MKIRGKLNDAGIYIIIGLISALIVISSIFSKTGSPSSKASHKPVKFEVYYAIYTQQPFIQITGMMSQTKPLLPYSFDDSSLIFKPGKLETVVMEVDKNTSEQITAQVYAIPKTPTVLCESEQTEEECLEANIDNLPDLIFFAKLDRPLSSNYHTVSFSFDGQPNFSSAYFDSSIQVNKSEIHLWPEALDAVDSCHGYHGKQTMIALPTLDMPNVNYALLIPDNKGTIQKDKQHLAYTKINDQMFLLFFPPSMKINKGIALRHLLGGSSRDTLHIAGHSVYTFDGMPAGFDKVQTYPDKAAIYLVIPYLQDGSAIFSQAVPREVISSSSCDG